MNSQNLPKNYIKQQWHQVFYNYKIAKQFGN
jgi:hypothetical protein